MGDYILFVICEIYVTSIVFVGFALIKKFQVQPEIARKFVHILSSFWSFPLTRFDNVIIAVASPCVFVFTNSFFVFSHFSAKYGFGDRRRNIGFILYPISLTLMTALLMINAIDNRIFLLATFILGFSDGFAGLVGFYWGRHIYDTISGRKSIEGSSCFAVTTFILCLFFGFEVQQSFFISIIAMSIEAFSIKGFDNLFIPAGVIIMGEYLDSAMKVYQSLMLVFILSLLVAIWAYKKRLLRKSGVIALICLLLIGGILGGIWVVVFYTIFLFSAYYTGKISKDMKDVQLIVKKTGARDWVQVFANGLPSLAALVLFSATRLHVYLIIFTAVIGQACADTWASDIGVRSKKKPISITTLKQVNNGESGGISVLGTFSALICACLYGVLGQIAFRYEILFLPFVVFVIVIGVMIDSFLGATIQVHYEGCQDGESFLTEIGLNPDGTSRKKARGLRFVNNDMVNFLSGVCTGVVAGFLFFMITL